MVNLIVRLPGKRPEKILITGHYDTKFFRDQVFVGANDGGSSGAFLIELARVLKDRPRELTYEFVWFDGEEAFCFGWTECGTTASPDNTYGSRYYVRQAQEAKAIASLKAMILVDMIGDRDLVIKREQNSTTWLKDIIWARRQTRRPRRDVRRRRDRHRGRPLPVPQGRRARGGHHRPRLPAVAPHVGHRHASTRSSARSLQIVGDVLLAALPDIEKRLVK